MILWEGSELKLQDFGVQGLGLYRGNLVVTLWLKELCWENVQEKGNHYVSITSLRLRVKDCDPDPYA